MVDFSNIHLNPRRFNIDFENDVRSHTHDLNPHQLNAAKHAGVSAVIADFASPFVAREFGVLNEAAQDIWGLSDGAPSVSDDTKDDFNNAIGRGIQAAYPDLAAAEYYRGIGELARAGHLVTDPLFTVDFDAHPRLRQRNYFKQRHQAVDNALAHARESGLFGSTQSIDHIDDKAKSSHLSDHKHTLPSPYTGPKKQIFDFVLRMISRVQQGCFECRTDKYQQIPTDSGIEFNSAV
ncbi:MAG: hypothetical protein NXI27_25985 [Alphaproteobacteria bacterium]|nr:hypothetical protein [Alphaproteobacteria bacterium]